MPFDVTIVGRDAEFFVENLARHFPRLGFHHAENAVAALDVCVTSEILLIRTDQINVGLVDAMPKLRLIQALTTGTDHIEALKNFSPAVMITAARGFHGPAMSELAFLFMLAFTRDVRKLVANQRKKIWDRRPQRLLFGKTALLLGVGRIAEDLALRCRCFGMRVVGVSARQAVPGFDALHPRNKLFEAAREADFLIVLLPSSKDNHHAVDADVLAAMKPSAVLINLARGDVVDEVALVRALAAQRIAGAGLDVFATEPLPTTSPLWEMPNVLLTSHVGGMSDIYAEQVLPLLIDNLAAFVAGEPQNMRFIVRHGQTSAEPNAKG